MQISPSGTGPNFAQLRAEMVRTLTSGRVKSISGPMVDVDTPISEPVQQAMLKVPRESFIPEKLDIGQNMYEYLVLRGTTAGLSSEDIEKMKGTPIAAVIPYINDPRSAAYEDSPIQIGEGQTISQPHMLAVMVTKADLKRGDRVLDVGSGSGYSSVIEAEVVGPEGKVYGIERNHDLAVRSSETIKKLGYNNIEIIEGDGSVGYEAGAPYDAIIVGGAVPAVSGRFFDQLKIKGRLIIPVGNSKQQTLVLSIKTSDDPKQAVFEPISGCLFIPIIGEQGFAG